jgi:hypothetical protein
MPNELMARRLTAADICAVTGYSRDELHALLRVLPPYNLEKPGPRVAREFTAKDILVLSVTQILEGRYGVRRTAVGEIGALLQDVLGGPRLQSEGQCLVVTIRPPSVRVAESLASKEGLVLPLWPLYERIDTYLSYDPQLSLQFGPTLVRKYG